MFHYNGVRTYIVEYKSRSTTSTPSSSLITNCRFAPTKATKRHLFTLFTSLCVYIIFNFYRISVVNIPNVFLHPGIQLIMKFSTLSLLFTNLATVSAFAPTLMGSRLNTQLDARKPFISGNWKLNPQ
jgi:hypothetical protein